MTALVRPEDMVFQCEEPEKDSAFIVIRERWQNGRRIILEWRYPTENDTQSPTGTEER